MWQPEAHNQINAWSSGSRANTCWFCTGVAFRLREMRAVPYIWVVVLSMASVCTDDGCPGREHLASEAQVTDAALLVHFLNTWDPNARPSRLSRTGPRERAWAKAITKLAKRL